MLSIAGNAPTLGLDLLVPAGSLNIVGIVPVVVGETQRITPTTGSLTLTGQTPAVVQSTVITPSAGSLVLVGAAPRQDLGIIVPVGSLIINGNAPIIVSTQTILRISADAFFTITESSDVNFTVTESVDITFTLTDPEDVDFG